jgi:hypothetical protein
MLGKLRPRSIYDVLATVACFLALGTGTAYAANTIRTGDIVDNEVFTTDVRDDTLGYGGLTHPDLGTGSVRSSELLDNSVTRFDIGTGEVDGVNIRDENVGTAEVRNNSLNDEDVGQGTFVNFVGNVGIINAHSCVADAALAVTGINAQGDHLLLTPNWETARQELSYSIEYRSTDSSARIKVCNPTNANIDDGTTNFNLLVIDAQ